MIRVAGVDDHAAVRAGRRANLAPEPDLSVAGSAANEHEPWAQSAAGVDPGDHAVLATRLAGVVPPDIASTLGLPVADVALAGSAA